MAKFSNPILDEVVEADDVFQAQEMFEEIAKNKKNNVKKPQIKIEEKKILSLGTGEATNG